MPLNGLLSCFRRKQTDSSEYNAFPLMRRLTKETIIYAPNILRSGINFRELVRLPEEESLSNWIALHGPRYEYRWADGETFKKPTPLPAPKYIEYLMDWTESQINNENVFPVTTDVPFPKSFINLCRKILTRLFRVFVHVNIHHFDRIVSIGAEDHVNTCYKHFYYFVQEFKLISAREIGPLTEVTARVCGN